MAEQSAGCLPPDIHTTQHCSCRERAFTRFVLTVSATTPPRGRGADPFLTPTVLRPSSKSRLSPGLTNNNVTGSLRSPPVFRPYYRPPPPPPPTLQSRFVSAALSLIKDRSLERRSCRRTFFGSFHLARYRARLNAISMVALRSLPSSLFFYSVSRFARVGQLFVRDVDGACEWNNGDNLLSAGMFNLGIFGMDLYKFDKWFARKPMRLEEESGKLMFCLLKLLRDIFGSYTQEDLLGKTSDSFNN